MNRQDFLNELSERLADIPHREATRVLNYYSEAIDDRIEDGMNEEEAVRAMGSADDIAREVLGEGASDAEETIAVESAAPGITAVAEPKKPEESAGSGSKRSFSFEYDSSKKQGVLKSFGSEEAAEEADALAEHSFAADEVRGICLEELSGDVEVMTSPDGRIRVESEDWRGLTCALEEDGTLSIKRKRVRKSGKFLGISFDFDYAPTGDVTLRIPEGCAVPVSVSTVSGDIDVRCPDAASLKVSAVSGDILVDSVTVAEQTAIATTSGDVELKALATNELAVKTTSGDVELCDVAAHTLDLVTVNGDAELTGCAADGRVSAISTNGDLEIGIESVVANGHFETVSGDLAVTLGGNEDVYAIRIKDGPSPEVVYGNPNGNPLVLRTAAGDVELNFFD